MSRVWPAHKSESISRINTIGRRNYLSKAIDMEESDDENDAEIRASDEYSIDPNLYSANTNDQRFKQIQFSKNRINSPANNGFTAKIEGYIASAMKNDTIMEPDDLSQAFQSPIKRKNSTELNKELSKSPKRKAKSLTINISDLRDKLSVLTTNTSLRGLAFSNSDIVESSNPGIREHDDLNLNTVEFMVQSPDINVFDDKYSPDAVLRVYKHLFNESLNAEEELLKQRENLSLILHDCEKQKSNIQESIDNTEQLLLSRQKSLSNIRTSYQVELNKLEKSRKQLSRKLNKMQDSSSLSYSAKQMDSQNLDKEIHENESIKLHSLEYDVSLTDAYSNSTTTDSDSIAYLTESIASLDSDRQAILSNLSRIEHEYNTAEEELSTKLKSFTNEINVVIDNIDNQKFHWATVLKSVQERASQSSLVLKRFAEKIKFSYQNAINDYLKNINNDSKTLDIDRLRKDLNLIDGNLEAHEKFIIQRSIAERDNLKTAVLKMRDEYGYSEPASHSSTVSFASSLLQNTSRPNSAPISQSGRSTPKFNKVLASIYEDSEITQSDESLSSATTLNLTSFSNISNTLQENLESTYDQTESNIGDEYSYLPGPHAAAMRGNLTQLMIFYKAEPNLLKSIDEFNRSPLFYAMMNGSSTNVKYILDLYPELVLCQDINGETACHAGASSGSCDCLKILLKVCESIKSITVKEYVNIRNKAGMTAVHVSLTAECLEVLYNCGADLTVLDADGRSPLFVACALDRVECAEFCIHYLDLDNSSIMTRDYRGDTPLHASSCNGAVNCLLLLLQYAIDPTIADKKGYKAVELAIKNNHRECQKLLTEYTIHYFSHSDFDSVLFLAALEGQKRVKKDVKRSGLVETDREYEILKPFYESSPRNSDSNNDMFNRKNRSVHSFNALGRNHVSLFSLRSNQTMKLQRWGQWISYIDNVTQKIYWFNHETFVGQWNIPDEVSTLQKKALGDSSNDAEYSLRTTSMKLKRLGEWIQYSTNNGKTFYYNEKTGDFQWKNPYRVTISPNNREKTIRRNAAFVTAEDTGPINNSFMKPNNSLPNQGQVAKFGDWRPFMDPVSGYVFWYNQVTGVSQWDCPSEVRSNPPEPSKFTSFQITNSDNCVSEQSSAILPSNPEDIDAVEVVQHCDDLGI